MYRSREGLLITKGGVGMELIEQKVREYITSELLRESRGKLDRETPLIEEGVIDSLGLFRLVAFIEEAFGVAIQDEDLRLENFQTIRQIGQYVTARLQGR